MKTIISKTTTGLAISAGLFWTCLAAERAAGREKLQVAALTRAEASAEEGGAGGETKENQEPKESRVIIRDIETEGERKRAKPVTWLGVAVAETTEALCSQLGLKRGEGLLVSYVAPESPAAKAELKPNDVLVELDGQMLVDPVQLRKLVQMHEEGDPINLVLFRGGKKQTISAKLGKTSWREAAAAERGPSSGRLQDLAVELKGLGDFTGGLKDQMKDLAKSLSENGVDRQQISADVREAIEEARKAVQEAMREARRAQRAPRALGKDLEDLAGRGMDIDKDATIVVKKDKNSVRTVVKSDDDGSYVIVANPRKHLTAHDKHGKLVFDGEIETPAQQKNVPKEIWEKVRPMLEQAGPEQPAEPEEPEEPAKPKDEAK
ncbi:putative PDZ/DHR/GLGF domain protein [Verrucomicrobia bacterium]|nr:putative PDZ/DHR/GLGF domain protein [Verrucomicrobiota bacterium]